MLTRLEKTPFPYFGGKSDAAAPVWAALGDCSHYVEPFAGSLAVLMRRPHPANRAYHSETVNDSDGLLVNAWRSIQLSPDETAAAASNPVAEADLHARHLALCKWRESRNLERLMGDPGYHDANMGGWWIWGMSCWIGGGWCSGTGAWIDDGTGRLARRNGGDPGVERRVPYLSGGGRGFTRPGTREPGVERQVPDLSCGGRGFTHPGTREPGVDRQRPDLSCGGRGFTHPGTREPGVDRQRPHLGDNGQGFHHAGAREPGVDRAEPDDSPYHPVTMPEAVRWMRFLSARLRHVRILNGDWSRAVTTGAAKMLEVRMGKGVCGVFLDPPYGTDATRATDIYVNDSVDVAREVLAWCAKNGDDPDYRIVLAGFEGEHDTLEGEGWRAVEWFKKGFMKGGMANLGDTGSQQHRERLWLSPHCLSEESPRQQTMDLELGCGPVRQDGGG